jgi:hypothetical protein
MRTCRSKEKEKKKKKKKEPQQNALYGWKLSECILRLAVNWFHLRQFSLDQQPTGPPADVTSRKFYGSLTTATLEFTYILRSFRLLISLTGRFLVFAGTPTHGRYTILSLWQL